MNSILLLVVLCQSPADYGVPQGAYVKKYDYLIAPNYETRNPLWVLEYVDKEHLKKNVDRGGLSFKPDYQYPKSYRVTSDTYLHSVYDRGHMAPAANHSYNKDALTDTFLYSNCCPQLKEFNRGIWAKLEDDIRDIAEDADGVWILTAPLYGETPNKLGNVWIPDFFCKSILVKRKTIELHSWLLPHRMLSDYDDYKISVDDLESKLGLDLWSVLNDPVLEMKK